MECRNPAVVNSNETAAIAPVSSGLGCAPGSRSQAPSAFRALRGTVAALALFALYAQASGPPKQNEGPCVPGVFDPAKGVRGGECYLKDEMGKALAALNQPIVLQANRMMYRDNVDLGLSANFFTFNAETGQGINFEADAPLEDGPRGWKAYKATRAYTRALYGNAQLFDPGKPGPSARFADEIGGTVGNALLTGEGNGYRLVFKADSADKHLFVGVNAEQDGLFFFAGPDREPVTLATWMNCALTEQGRAVVNSARE